jgi:HlyD family secretion protein
MNRNRLVIIIALFCAILVVAAIFIRETHSKKANILTLFGNVDIREVDLSFRVLGRLQELLVEEGDEVCPGQLVALLDKEPFEDELREAQARVELAKISLTNAEKIFKRREELITSEAVSKEDFDETSASWKRAQASLEQAVAAHASSFTRLKDTIVYSPSKGTVLTRVREPGSIVKIGDPVCTISLKTPIQIRAYITEEELGLIYPGMPARIHIDTPLSPIYNGRIGFISSVAEFTPKTVQTLDLRTDLVYRLRIVVDNPDRQLRQGMPVTIILETDSGHEKYDLE